MEQEQKKIRNKYFIMLGMAFLWLMLLLTYVYHFNISKKIFNKTPGLMEVGFFILIITGIIIVFLLLYYSLKWLSLQYKNKSRIYSKIETYEDALSIIKGTSQGCYVLASLQFVIGFMFLQDFTVIADCIIYLLLGFLLQKYKSKVCAAVLLLISIGALVMTVLNLVKVTNFGGTNVILAIAMMYMSIQAIKATTLLNKLKNKSKKADVIQGDN